MVEIYDVETEIKYRKLYDQKLRDIMVGDKVTQDNRIEAALEVYDGKTFMNTYGIKYEIKVNKDAKYSNEVLIVKASRNGMSDVQSLDPSLVSLYLG